VLDAAEKTYLSDCVQLRLSISHSLNEAIGEKDEEDADVDVASLTRLQVRLLYKFGFCILIVRAV
jgi:hypothetical protein